MKFSEDLNYGIICGFSYEVCDGCLCSMWMSISGVSGWVVSTKKYKFYQSTHERLDLFASSWLISYFLIIR